jgi:hypothetical protein
VELAITDSLSASTKKTVSMLVADGRSGRIRSDDGGHRLNVDTRADALPDGRIVLSLTMDYFPDQASPTARASVINESIVVLVSNGKPTLVSQSADPTGDRKVSVEVTATILK